MWNDSHRCRGRQFLAVFVFALIALVGSGCSTVSNISREVSYLLAATPTTDPAFYPTPTPVIIDIPAIGAFPDPSDYRWVQVAAGLQEPTALASAGDGRLLVLEKAGVIRTLADGQVQDQPLLDIRARVGSTEFEQGLLGIAVHPRFGENGYIYVNYTDLRGDTVIARFTVSSERADPASEMRLLEVEQPYVDHNGGGLAFGPDGKLYIGLGDGGAGGDPDKNAQNLRSYLGKILRIDVDNAEPYGIPSDNPFAGETGSTWRNPGNLPEIWAYGLRNPWRISFDARTGNMYVGDVGQETWEEIDFYPAGAPGGVNFGWNFREGAHPFEGDPDLILDLVDPVAEYGHDSGCSVTGGDVYRGKDLPEWDGVYFFGDFCSGTIWGLLYRDGAWAYQQLFTLEANISSFGIDEIGEMYALDIGGEIYKLVRK